MKLLFLFCTALLCTRSFAQGEIKSQRENAVSKFIRMAGTVALKEVTDIGDVGKMKLQLVRVKNIADSNATIIAGRMVYKFKDIHSPDVQGPYIDQLDIDWMIMNFTTLDSKVFSKNATGYREVSFLTKNEITCGAYWKNDGWAGYLKLNDTDEDSYIFLEKNELNTFISLLKDLKSKMRPGLK